MMDKEEIHSVMENGTTPWDLNELANLAVENYKKAAKVKVGWHVSAEPGMVSMTFIDGSGNAFDQIAVKKHDYINIFKPAILSISN